MVGWLEYKARKYKCGPFLCPFLRLLWRVLLCIN
nr:MAG TPA: hypothetical protein [Caudoviricetes sp.]